jgi:hypothetical protein
VIWQRPTGGSSIVIDAASYDPLRGPR